MLANIVWHIYGHVIVLLETVITMEEDKKYN